MLLGVVGGGLPEGGQCGASLPDWGCSPEALALEAAFEAHHALSSSWGACAACCPPVRERVGRRRRGLLLRSDRFRGRFRVLRTIALPQGRAAR